MPTLPTSSHSGRVHRQTIALMLVLALGGLYLIYAVNVFVDESLATVDQLRIELDEALVYGAAMTLMFGGYALRLYRSRLAQHRRQSAQIEEARRTGETDALTGLPNRRRFDAVLRIMRDQRNGGCDAVMMIDLNAFKPVNDRYGHAEGDAVLRIVADRLAAVVRAGDLVARIGGDEFVVLAPAIGDAAAAAALADRLIAVLEQPIATSKGTYAIGAGIGIALGRSADVEGDTIVAAADRALYRAKAEGRSAYHFAD